MRIRVGIRRTLLAATAALALSGTPHFANAQAAPTAAPAAAAATVVQPDYHPSMGDLMTMAVRPRHIKLGLAGKQSNWPYASYELSELRNAFARIARTIPKYQTMDTAEMTTALTKAPLDALDQAIAKTNTTQFGAAYAQLTQACNVCHQSQKHGAVVITAPDAAMFPDQDFRPATR
jgi:hypothetical protein